MQRSEQAEQLANLGVVEAGADVPDIAQPAAVVDSEGERAERSGAATGAARVAGDDELLLLLHLDLEPVTRAAALEVARIDPLRNHALELLRGRRLEQGVAVLEAFRPEHGAVAAVEQLLQPRPPLAKRQVDERQPVGLEEVEDVVDERAFAALQLGEARPAGRIEPADLAVEDGVRRLHRSRYLVRDLGEPRRQVLAVPRDESHVAGSHVRDRAVAVELDLEQPAGACRQAIDRRRQHRRIVVPAGRRLDVATVAALDQQPVLLLPVEVGRDQRPVAVQALAVQPHGQLAVALLL